MAGNQINNTIANGNLQTQAETHAIPQQQRSGTDPEAQEMVISSLRTQIQDLFSQVSELNTKLVKSYNRVSDLEDDLHVASSNARASSIKISQLELERTQHLAALNTGLLVEKSHVTAELTRLMEKATEEAAQRGQAESARVAIEKDLDDLSATLFGQANTMVAEARYAQHLQGKKLEDSERALKDTEELVGVMQRQMQTLQLEKETAENKMQNMQQVVGKGKWRERPNSGNVSRPLRLLSSHNPYQEFLFFVAHLRSLHGSSPNIPAMSTLLPLPFLVRLLTEDSEPTVRLDLAPSLNWLSRRAVLSAIHTGQLTVEPIASSSLLLENSPSTTVAGLNSSCDNISCAMCGALLFPVADHNTSRPDRLPPYLRSLSHGRSNSGSWSSSLLKTSIGKSILNGNSRPPSPPRSPTYATQSYPQQVYIFRTSPLTPSALPSLAIPSLSKSGSPTTGFNSSMAYSISSTAGANNQSITIYPLCTTGWCLARLRTTCSLWAYVRTGIVEKVWEEHVPIAPPPAMIQPPQTEKPPVPPRKRGLWGGIASAIGEKAASWSEGDKNQSKPPSSAPSPQPQPPQPQPPHEPRRLPPPPPPIHPSITNSSYEVPFSKAPHTPSGTLSAVPPLPPRNVGRSRTPINAPDDSQNVPIVKAPPLPPRRSAEESKGPNIESVPPSHPSLVDSTPLSPIPPHLQETVTTPAHRPGTPSSVPLPESRPSTPIQPPARTSSPATTGSPPPLPRRAAARAVRPLSMLVDGGSRPGTPATPTQLPPAVETLPEDREETTNHGSPAPDASELNNKVSTPENDKSTEEVKDGPDDLSVPPTAASNRGEDKDPSVPSSPISEEAFEDALSPAEDADKKSDYTFIESRDEKDADKDDDENVHDGDTSTVGVDEKYLKTEKEADQSSLDEKEEAGNSDVDEGAYIGDATWEERAWKELVRLREDMFWARVGGFK